jgi:hypothetical protein
MGNDDKVKWKPLLRRLVAESGGSIKRKELKRKLVAELGDKLPSDGVDELLEKKAKAAGLEVDGKLIRAPPALAEPPADASVAGPPLAKRARAAEPAAAKPLAACTAAEASAYWAEHEIAVSGDGVSSFRPCLKFADAGFDAQVVRATATFDAPTPIQATCWPIALAGRDVIGIAETGSGKTLGFFLPALMHIRRDPSPPGRRPIRVLVLSPTRELAMQTESLIRSAGSHCAIEALCVYGGVPKGPQKKALQSGIDVVVATPGRLLDLYQNDRAADLSSASFVVLDEADRLLDLGFEKDVRTILDATAKPPRRQTAMFTATWPDSVRELATDFLTKPVTVTVGSTELTANHRVQQIVEVLEPDRKDAKLLQLLAKYHSSRKNRVLVFALYKKVRAAAAGPRRRLRALRAGRTPCVRVLCQGSAVPRECCAEGVLCPGSAVPQECCPRAHSAWGALCVVRRRARLESRAPFLLLRRSSSRTPRPLRPSACPPRRRRGSRSRCSALATSAARSTATNRRTSARRRSRGSNPASALSSSRPMWPREGSTSRTWRW